MTPVTIAELASGKIVGYACCKCRTLSTGAMLVNGPTALGHALRQATDCCVPKVCEIHGLEIEQCYIYCKKCRGERAGAKEHERFCAAKKVRLADYDGEYLYRDGFGNDGYFQKNEAHDCDYQDDDGPITWAWGCTEQTVTLDDCGLADHVYESILADYHESAGDFVDDAKVARAEQLLFEACGDVKSYMGDNSVVVLFDGYEP